MYSKNNGSTWNTMKKKVKQDVRQYGMNDNIVNQLIQLYQQKLWLLKELQTEINKMNVRAQQHPDLRQRDQPRLFKTCKQQTQA